MYEYNAKVLNVVDGDTLHMDVDLGCDVHTHLTVRLYGVDCPEKNTPEGQAAKQYTKDWLMSHSDPKGYVILKTLKDRREKYGRYLGIIDHYQEQSLNDALIENGHAVSYDGGKR